MGSITIFENPLDHSDSQEFEHLGPFIEFLQGHFPAGFEGRSHVTAFNGSKVPVKDYDKIVGPTDRVVIAILPALPAGVIVGLGAMFLNYVAPVIIGMVVSTLLNYAINRFFGPKGTKPLSPNPAGTAVSGGLPAASPTYSLGPPSNVARLGQPIPVAYGENLLVPDLAAYPYSWFENNEHYVGLLLCLGQGQFNIQQTLVGNTDVTSLAPGVITTVVFPGYAHAQTFGVIQNNSQILENVYSSPEVSDQLFAAAVGAEDGAGYSSSGNLFNQDGHACFYLDTDASYWADTLKNGKQVWAIVINSTAPGNNSPPDTGYTVTYIANPGQKYAGHFGHISLSSWPAGASNATIQLSLTNPAYWDQETPGGSPLGPYAATPAGVYTTYLQYDIAFQNGCYDSDSTTGNITALTVGIQFRAEQVNDAGVPLGPVYEYYYTEAMGTTTPQRRTLHHAVPYGRYRVTGLRTTPKPWTASSSSECYWVGLKAILGNTAGGTVYGDVTLMAIKARATEGLASDALNRISVRCTRYNPRDGVLSRNPADAFLDIVTNQTYGGKRPDSEIDWATWTAMKNSWAAAGKVFDAVYDTSNDLWGAMGMSLQMVHTAPTMAGSLISLVEDKDYLVHEFALTEDTIKSLSLTFLFDDGTEVDGIEGAYRDPDDTAELFVTYPPTAVNPEKVELFGCRNEANALAYVTQRWKQLSLRRLLVTIETELEGEVIRVGAPILVTHPTLMSGVPTMCVVHSIKANGEFARTLECHRHESGVYA